MFTCERPGGDPPKKKHNNNNNDDNNDTTIVNNNKIDTKTKVAEWVQFMTGGGRNIRHVFILLTDKELNDAYAEPGLIQAYKEAGIVANHIPYASPKSYQAIMKELDEVHALGEQAVAHCTHGIGRSGRVAAGWLVYKYGLGVDQAVEEALEAARAAGVQRMGSPHQLTDWIAE